MSWIVLLVIDLGVCGAGGVCVCVCVYGEFVNTSKRGPRCGHTQYMRGRTSN